MFNLKYYVLHASAELPTLERKIRDLKQKCSGIQSITIESCYLVRLKGGHTSSCVDDLKKRFQWIFSEAHLIKKSVSEIPHLKCSATNQFIIEVGPRLNFSTPFSTNVVAICHAIGLDCVERVEKTSRFLITFNRTIEARDQKLVEDALHDRMTESVYDECIFKEVEEVPGNFVQEYVAMSLKGRSALEEIDSALGLGFDDWDLNNYADLFKKMGRDPTVVECFDLAQSNSEHSRHWFFKGDLFVDGQKQDGCLFDWIIDTQKKSNPNNVIKFSDNSSAISGFEVRQIVPEKADSSSAFRIRRGTRHIVFTAETHNFPTAISPFSGATTGTGGRIRDVQAVGRGGHVIAASAGYCFGNLYLPGYGLPWEETKMEYPVKFATPVEVAIEASDGASDYGNKFGEPVIVGFVRSFGMVLPNGQRKEWVKPIMFSGGIGSVDEDFVSKIPPEKGMLVVKVGGLPYRVGIGGGAASSVQVQGDNQSDLDFNAVQRGDAEMEQKMNRVIRGCIENGLVDGRFNPILSIHDQGAGGNGNVLKELVEPAGAVIRSSQFTLGDQTMNPLEVWGAEYQESNAILCSKEDVAFVKSVASRERCPMDVVGEVTGDGKIVFEVKNGENGESFHPVDLPLDSVLGALPKKSFYLTKSSLALKALVFPDNFNVLDALERVLRLTSVGSKRWLTNKVDRSVTGLVVQQQCVGPFHVPISDVGVVALSYFDSVGSAMSIGEQPIKGLVDPAVGARMAVAEMITNLACAPISDLKDVKCSGNWMWAAKIGEEGEKLVAACRAMCEVMKLLGIAVDGGKDSLSMAAKLPSGETVVSPGSIVISGYAPCVDFNGIVTPDLKMPLFQSEGRLILIRPCSPEGASVWRLGGSALAQCLKQLGNESPDLDYPEKLASAFELLQILMREKVLKAMHDISDGGFVVCCLEMAFGGYCSLDLTLPGTGLASDQGPLSTLFGEEVGWVVEVEDEAASWSVCQSFLERGIFACDVGKSFGFGSEARVTIRCGEHVVLDESMVHLLILWEETSFQLEKLQARSFCAESEFEQLKSRRRPSIMDATLNSEPLRTEQLKIRRSLSSQGIPVCVWREEGSNGDREMVAALHMAGFDVWDVTTSDVIEGNVTLNRFRGIIFPGGFSYADALGSAKGWAASLIFHEDVRKQLQHWKNRDDTFSLGVCNGCQLMALLGWIDDTFEGDPYEPHGVVLGRNDSGRFESRFSWVRFEPKNKSIFCRGLDNLVLGVWVAHGEGKFNFRDESVFDSISKSGCVAFRYVDDSGDPTEVYPFNPNGSQGGIAGVCSSDGRHLALMPHPERCVYWWQWPFLPFPDQRQGDFSPWLKFFQNSYNWCKS